MRTIIASLSANLDSDLLKAALPLFATEKVGAIEWSFDALFQLERIPDWFRSLLQAYADAGRLTGHGIYFSLFQGRWTAEQQAWLAQLESLVQYLPLEQVTEHFGFMTGQNFHQGAPIGVPLTASTLALGRDRLARIQAAANCPVGLENLAIAYSLDEVQRQGEFLSQLLEPVNGFMILDVHNLYCQLHNFDLDAETLLQTYDLERVREIHISGGSWQESSLRPDRPVRRDTHDDGVPEMVFELLETCISRCSNLRYVVLEQVGEGLRTAASKTRFQSDFLRMEAMVATANLASHINTTSAFLPALSQLANEPISDENLHSQQVALSQILETAKDVQEAQLLLAQSSLAQSAWQTEQWHPVMLDTVLQIAQKWKHGFLPER